MDWMDRDRWWGLMIVVMNIQGLYNLGNSVVSLCSKV